MDLPDSLTTRRAVLGGVGTLLAGGGVVYAAPRLGESTPPGRPASAAADTPGGTATGFHSSSATTGFGIDLAGNPVVGAVDAPVDIYYWSDYECPFCRRFERGAFPKIVENHVRTGTVRLVFIQFPYLSSDSMTAAVMDRCVWRQVRDAAPGRYLRWHSAVFEAQGEKGSGWASKESLLAVTRRVEGVDASAIDERMRADRSDIETAIETDIRRAREVGIDGTPAFVLYNRAADRAGKLVGAQPYDRFDAAITKVENA